MDRLQIDPEVAESLAGVVRLLTRAGRLVWARSDLEGPRSPHQLLGIGVDLVADESRSLLADLISIHGPEPVGDEPVELLRSAARLLHQLCLGGAPTPVHALRTRVAELLWEANTGAGA